MPITMYWEDDDKVILHHVHEGEVTGDDFHNAIDENFRLQSEVSHDVYVITDVRLRKGSPQMPLTSMSSHMENKVPPTQRLVVIVGGDTMTRMRNKIIKGFAPKTTENMVFVNTVEEAYEMIEKYRNRV